MRMNRISYSGYPAGTSANARLDAIFGQLQRIGIESTGSYGAGLLR
jgi:hypothetical protein